MRKKRSNELQGVLFEDDYLLRTLGSIARNPEIALTELVANARDAGASRVDVSLPVERGGAFVIEDDGTGMTGDQFRNRWMMLSYDRLRHQGAWVEFPPGRSGHRRAFGRNGVGRHGLLCFADQYTVETIRDGYRSRFVVSTKIGSTPFGIVSEVVEPALGFGTKISAVAERNIPDSERIRQVLGSRFLQDPAFEARVNGRAVPLTDLNGFIAEFKVEILPGYSARVLIFDSQVSSRIVAYQGIAFWVCGKLVGTPSWLLGDWTVFDGRTRAGRRFSVVVQCDDKFADLVEPDWTGLRRDPLRDQLWAAVGDGVSCRIKELLKERASDVSVEGLRQHREVLRNLPTAAAMEVVDFAQEIVAALPSIEPDTLSAAIRAVINIERTRHGAALLERLAALPEDDIEALDKLLSEWTARDALTVLDEIDARVKVIEAIDRLGGDEAADEVRTLHPLITQARWVFGPEFDSPEYASNLSLRNAVDAVFRGRVVDPKFLNPRKRPDLVVLADATLSIVATESIDPTSGLSRLGNVLLIELKKGRSEIGREEMNQADGYVQDLLQCGHLDGPPFIKAFVVGHKVANRTETTRTVGEGPKARIEATTFAQLTRTAGQRLFRLREALKERYGDIESSKLLCEVLDTPTQLSLQDVTGKSQ
jgi:hypothetical protein